MMAAFADQAALAWQLASAQRRMRELDVLTDRDRIARDLHYHVIQRLFAVGLALQGLRRNDATAATAGRGDRPVFESRTTYQRAVRGRFLSLMPRGPIMPKPSSAKQSATPSSTPMPTR